MFERFAKDTRRTVVRARHEALRAGADQVGCEHLLLGLLAEPGPATQALAAAGLAISELRAQLPGGPVARQDPLDAGPANPDPLDAEALAAVGIDLDSVRRATDAAFGPGALDRARSGRRGRPRATPHVSLSDDAKRSLELALRSTVRLQQSSISTGHLLIGMLDQADNAALDILTAAGVDLAAVRADVAARLTAA